MILYHYNKDDPFDTDNVLCRHKPEDGETVGVTQRSEDVTCPDCLVRVLGEAIT